MEEQEVFSILEGAGDAAFAVDQSGLIRFWSRKAEELLGYRKTQVLQKNCAHVLEGKNESGSAICCDDCQILEMARKTGEVANYDLHARTATGESKWLNVSILVFQLGRTRPPLVVHLLRDIGHRKRLENLTRDILVSVGQLTGQKADEIIRRGAPVTPAVDLTPREKDILRLLSLGRNASAIAAELHLSPATVRNHVQHILGKMGCHSQLEAALRAVRENLI